MTPQPVPSSLTTTYVHRGCCEQFAGVTVDLHSVVHAETGSYVPPPNPRCVLAETDLHLAEATRPTYPRRT